MAKTKLPSPPSSNPGTADILQSGFQQLVQHNGRTSFPRVNLEYDEGIQLLSAAQSQFGSPAPAYQGNSYHYNSQQPSYSYHRHQDSGVGMGIQFNGYRARLDQFPEGRAASPQSPQVYAIQYDTPESSSPTPSIPTPGSEPIRTRSGMKIKRPLQSLKPLPRTTDRVSKNSKTERIKKEKIKPEKKIAQLEKPLSELTKDWTHVPVVDIGAYVNRPAEDRRQELQRGKSPGKVKRPMNSFMLYRKAYQNRTKAWCLQNNHQVVSQVCGDSWPLEPEEVRDKFKEWARVERQNHQNAHPGYKFSPSKPGTTKAVKSKFSQEPESDESDLDDYDWEKGRTKRQKKETRLTPRPETRLHHHPTPLPYADYSRESSLEPGMNSYHKSSYHQSNPGRAIPQQYDRSNLQHGQYYQQTVKHHSTIPNVEDVVIRKTAVPGMHYPGLPGGYDYSLVPQYQSQEANTFLEQQIDPSLVTHGQESGHEQYNEDGTFGMIKLDDEPQWQAPYGENDEPFDYLGSHQDYDISQIHEQHTNMLNSNREQWHIESLDAGQEFERWLDEE